MKLSEVLQKRGFIHQIAGESLEEIVDGEKRTIYLGVDPTADSIHAGNFVIYVLLRHLAEHGHKVILLAGGGTGRIGDPKPDAERELIDYDEVDRRIAKLQAQAAALLNIPDLVIVDNYEWLGKFGLIEFLRDIGKHFTVNELIKKDAIATRLSSDVGLSYTEFAYPLLQGYDYLELYKQYGCNVQVGGSDQWGNIVAGVELVRRKENAKVFAITVPLIIDKTTGKKFGKSEGNAVWLDAEKTSPYAFYQFWLNTADENVIDFLKRFTFVSLEEIAVLEKAAADNPGAREAQKRLAREVTTFVHGEVVAASVEKVSQILFGGGEIDDLGEIEIMMLQENAPTAPMVPGEALVDTLVRTELASSKREARTFIEDGAVSLGGVKITDTEYIFSADDITGAVGLLRRGKRQLCVLVK